MKNDFEDKLIVGVDCDWCGEFILEADLCVSQDELCVICQVCKKAEDKQ